jgi:hypothetical protein
VQQHAGQVMSPGFQPEQLTVQHVGQPRHRMPVGGVATSQCPPGVCPGQPTGHVRVIQHIHIVIVVDEVMARRRPVKGQGHQHQQDSHQPHRKTRPSRHGGGGPRRCGFGFGHGSAHRTPKLLRRVMLADADLGIAPAPGPLGAKVSCDSVMEFECEVGAGVPRGENAPAMSRSASKTRSARRGPTGCSSEGRGLFGCSGWRRPAV